MKIIVLQPSYLNSESIIKDLDIKRNLTPWLPGHEVEHVFLDKTTVNRQISRLKADVFVNLCDGAWDEDTPGLDVVHALEKERKAYTGAHSIFYDPSKEDMKKICFYWGVKTPAYAFVHSEEDVERAIGMLKFPCFIKHYHGYNSVGITQDSKVHNVEKLREQAFKMIKEFGGALIEEFVDGREFSVLVSSNPDNEREPFGYRPVECIFDEGINFKTFEYKWKTSRNPWVPVMDDALAQRLIEMTKAVFVAFKGTGYARSDIRMDMEGNLYFLEINPNCSIFYPDDNGSTADLIMQFDGIGKPAFLKRIIEHALHRNKQLLRKYQVQFDPDLGNGLVATENIAEGEVIVKLEEQAHHLVTKQHVEKTWSEKDKEHFKHFAYPLTDDLYAIWDPDPNKWTPINHSCDPNAWVTGLDLTARIPISKGDPITMDYATMYVTNPVEFTCMCKSHLCRGTWKGDDYQQAWFKERYGDHITDFVKLARKRSNVVHS